MPERFIVVFIPRKALYKCSALVDVYNMHSMNTIVIVKPHYYYYYYYYYSLLRQMAAHTLQPSQAWTP